MSTTIRWHISLALLIILIAGGALLAVLLALGLADPPRVGTRQFEAISPDSWNPSAADEFVFYEAPVTFPDTFTLELTAQNNGPANSAWGIRLLNDGSPLTILVDNQGYYSVGVSDTPDWKEFLHIQPDGLNKLYLHVTTDGVGTLRINNEIAGNSLKLTNLQNIAWGMLTYRQPQLIRESVALYHE